MSLYGYGRNTTPTLDALATRGVTFDRAIAPTPWTLPSHATFFTGLEPHEHAASADLPLGEEFRTVAEALGDGGYATGGFVANLEFTLEGTGIAQGFHRYRDEPLSASRFLASLPFVAWPFNVARRWTGDRTELVRKRADEINQEFLEWLDGPVADDRPFFAFLNYFDVHNDYEPQAPFDTLFSPAGDLYWISGPWNNAGRYSDAELEQLRTAYDEAFAYLDFEIGNLLAELEQRGRLENTVIIVTSDHGEHFGEHDLLVHLNSLYMPLLHVPLVVVHPAGGIPAGHRVGATVALSDLAATILELSKVDESLPGESLARFWRGEGIEEPVLTRVDYGMQRWTMRGIVDGTWNYIRNYAGPVPEELYDLSVDPWETRNLANDADPSVQDLLARLGALVDSLDTGPIPTGELPLNRR